MNFKNLSKKRIPSLNQAENMEIIGTSIFKQPYESRYSTEDDDCDYDKRERNQETPQYVIDSLPRYTVRPNGAYSNRECSCGICYCNYRVGDKIVCLPCQHNFHDYCIENWLKWVKDTCPVDKKSIIRRQYIYELNKERQNRILNLITDNDPQESASRYEGNFLTCKSEKNHLPDTTTIKEIANKKWGCKDIQGVRTQRDCSPKPPSPGALAEKIKLDRKKRESSITRNNLPKNISPQKRIVSATKQHEPSGKDCSTLSIFSSGSVKKLQVPVDAFRRNIKRGNLSAPKPKSPQKVQETFKTVNTKLASSSIFSPKVQGKQKGSKTCNRYEGSFGTVFPSRGKEYERELSLRGMGQTSLTFGDILEIESEMRSGWIYKRDKPTSFGKKTRKKLL